MKAVIALTASLAVANAALLPRQLESIPDCALNCAVSSLGSTGCSTTDFACICQATRFISNLVPCVRDACTADEYQATLVAASELCRSAGVTLSVPAGASPTGASSAASSSAASSATTTSAPSESSAATTSAASSAESSSEAMTSAASTTAAATTAGGNATVSSTSPPAPTGTEPGAASRNTIALGGLGAIVALVAAFL